MNVSVGSLQHKGSSEYPSWSLLSNKTGSILCAGTGALVWKSFMLLGGHHGLGCSSCKMSRVKAGVVSSTFMKLPEVNRKNLILNDPRMKIKDFRRIKKVQILLCVFGKQVLQASLGGKGLPGACRSRPNGFLNEFERSLDCILKYLLRTLGVC